jgi:predicted CXXCH cytochrome family protein
MALILILFIYFSIIEKPHPAIFEAEKTNCKVCHNNVFEGKVRHMPLESCLSCHKFEKKDGKDITKIAKEVPALCFDCHKEFLNYKENKVHIVFEECSNCHNFHSSNIEKILQKELPFLCEDCHNLKELKEKNHKNQPIQGTNCIGCHNPHFSKNEKLLLGNFFHKPFIELSCDGCHNKTLSKKVRLKAEGSHLCSACHSNLDLELKENYLHTPFKEGRCVKCHNPHLSEEKALLKFKEKDLCLLCHKNVINKKNIHMPLEDGCLSCHKPHSSSKDFLLSKDIMEDEKISSLCFSCHSADESLKTKHRNSNLKDIKCSICHNPHSSDGKKLLNENSVHPVFGDCESCHSEGVKTIKEGNELCFECHSDFKENLSSFKFNHSAIDYGCLTCHTPHISNFKPILKGSEKRICGECHQFDFPFEHKVISLFGCTSCHTPHGGSNQKFLKKEGNDLCLSCHLKETEIEKKLGVKFPKIKLDDKMERGHPTISHIVKGNIKKQKGMVPPKDMEEITCLSCHNPHGGQSNNLYSFNKRNQNELCQICHIK